MQLTADTFRFPFTSSAGCNDSAESGKTESRHLNDTQLLGHTSFISTCLRGNFIGTIKYLNSSLIYEKNKLRKMLSI